MHYQEQFFTGERSLFGLQNATIEDTTFGEGESPLKHSQNIKLQKTIFQWKYPLWYSHHINVNQSMFETMARSGIWYTDHITVTNIRYRHPNCFAAVMMLPCSKIILRMLMKLYGIAKLSS